MKALELPNLPLPWMMNNPEKIVLLKLLSDIQPELSIEIGTKGGGSMQLIASFSKTVYSLDIDAGVKALGKNFNNVNFIIGDSKQTLPMLLNELAANGEQPDFVLIDGDHSLEGVQSDIESVLKIPIKKPLLVIMHDSFNPECRAGMLTPDYKNNPYVETVDLDFVHGVFSDNEQFRGAMYGGFGMIYLKPGAIKSVPLIKQRHAYTFERTYKLSNHYHFLPGRSFTERLKSFVFKKMFI
jgi:Methyltransferase domain